MYCLAVVVLTDSSCRAALEFPLWKYAVDHRKLLTLNKQAY